MRIAITGAAGLVGRNLLFEFIKQNMHDLEALEIFILGRGNHAQNIQQRIEEIILGDGVAYMSLDEEQFRAIKSYYREGIKCIEADLSEDGLGINAEDMARLRSGPIDFFFHNAALTDLRDAPSVKNALKENNIHGTQRILDLIRSLRIGEFCYVSTAYTCGTTAGRIMPDYINTKQGFRNPYEMSKLRAEITVREFAKKTGVRCRYFRPSIICGRLIEPPLGGVHKFDVFYASAASLLRMKLKFLKNREEKYKTPVELNIRVCCKIASGLNIVPVDYVAKAMYQICIQQDPGESYHLVNEQATPNKEFVQAVLDSLNIKGVEIVGNIPDEMNPLESLYYKTVGRIYTPYINSEPMLFDTQNLQRVLGHVRLRCPPVDRKNLLALIDYAKRHDFGLKLGTRKSNC